MNAEIVCNIKTFGQSDTVHNTGIPETRPFDPVEAKDCINSNLNQYIRQRPGEQYRIKESKT